MKGWSLCAALVAGSLTSSTTWAQPPNDACANAITLVSGVVTQASITSSATRDGPATMACGTSPPPVVSDVWYKIVPARGGSATLTVATSAFPPVWHFVEVYAGTSCGTLGPLVACDAMNSPINRQYSLSVTGPGGFLVRLGVGTSTLMMFSLTYADPAPAPAPAAFTYQGRLTNSGIPASGPTDMTFRLWDAPVLGLQIGPTVTRTGVGVTNGLFTTMLDFGAGAFGVQDRWLEIATGAGGANVLSPRQQVTPAPYALYAVGAGNAAHAATADFATTSGNTGAGSVSVTNRVVTSLSSHTYTGMFPVVTESVQTVTLPAGTAVIIWSMSGYFDQSFQTARIRPSIGGLAAPYMSLGVNASGTSNFLTYVHRSISGSYSVHVPGGSTTIQLEVSGPLITDGDDSLSWTVVVFRD
jgi:hypothetical protein